jgi:hypothetical protein
LTQTGEELHAGIAIGWLDAEFALVIEHGKARRVADPAIGAAGVEAERGKAALKFLDLGEGRRRLAVGKLLDEGRTADASIAEISKDRARNSLPDCSCARQKNSRPEGKQARRDRQPSTRAGVWLRERLAVSARDAERHLPFGVTA